MRQSLSQSRILIRRIADYPLFRRLLEDKLRYLLPNRYWPIARELLHCGSKVAVHLSIALAFLQISLDLVNMSSNIILRECSTSANNAVRTFIFLGFRTQRGLYSQTLQPTPWSRCLVMMRITVTCRVWKPTTQIAIQVTMK